MTKVTAAHVASAPNIMVFLELECRLFFAFRLADGLPFFLPPPPFFAIDGQALIIRAHCAGWLAKCTLFPSSSSSSMGG